MFCDDRIKAYLCVQVEDVHALHSIIAGPDEHDILSQGVPLLPARRPRNASSLAGWRIGVCEDWIGSASSKVTVDNYHGSLRWSMGQVLHVDACARQRR